jgi:hypothetical protein
MGLGDPLVILVVLFAAVGVLLAWWWWSWDRSVDFLHRVEVERPAGEAGGRIFDSVVPVLVKDGYKMVARGGHTTILERKSFPVWTIVLAIVAFPIGLLALLARVRDTVVIVGRDDVLEVHGRCAKVTADFVMAAAEDAAWEQAPASGT